MLGSDTPDLKEILDILDLKAFKAFKGLLGIPDPKEILDILDLKEIEAEVIVSQRELESEIRWECMAAIKKIINKKKYKIININTYFYD